MRNLFVLCILVGFHVNGYCQTHVDNGLLAFYPFTNNAIDESGNTNNGTLVGVPTYTSDRRGDLTSALLFDGSSDYVDLGGQAIITGPAFSISCWARIDGAGGGGEGQNILFQQRNNGGSSSTIVFFAEDQSGNTRISIRNQGATILTSISNPAPTDGGWHLYTATLSSTGILRLYVDCVLVANNNSTISNGVFDAGVQFVDIGRHRYSGANQGFFNGAIDDVRIYNRDLAACEVSTLCSTCNEDLLGSYPFSEGTSTDITINGNTGTVFGATATSGVSGDANSALRFDGANDYVQLGTQPIITGSTFSLSCWARINGQGGGGLSQNVLFQQRDDSGTSSTIVFFAEDQLGNTRISVRTGPGTNTLANVAAPAPTDGNWHFYKATINQNGVINLYIDCRRVGTTNYIRTGGFSDSIFYVDIGRHTYQGVDRGFFNGDIDDFKIYNDAFDNCELNSVCSCARLSLPTPGQRDIVDMERGEGAPLNITVFPNPAKASVNFNLYESFQDQVQLLITDVAGKIIEQFIIDPGITEFVWDTQGIPDGIYFYQLISKEGKSDTNKLVIQKQ